MKKTLLVLTFLLGAYVLLGLMFGGAVGYLQPEDGGTAVLRTFDSDGIAYETMVRPVEGNEGQTWILSGQWFRSWYGRALENPEVSLRRNGRSITYRAVPIEDEGEIEMVLGLRRGDANSAGVFLYQALLLFAPVKILKLEATS